jgi:uncharacterized secreted protein with C-terminal beta-propeller domain
MLHFRRTRGWLSGCLLLCVAVAETACGSDSACTGADCAAAGSFESDLPAQQANAASGHREVASDAKGGAATLAPTTNAGALGAADNSAARAISEADIIQVQGERLYALSRVAGLAVIDISQPSALRLLGRYRELPADPFELYLRGDTALVMFTGWGEYAKLESGDYAWVTTSKLLALDVSNPSSIASIGSFDVPGSISDSRIVGDILYVVGHQDGYCWSCQQNKPLTSIVSLDVSDPHAVHKVDELAYADGDASWGPRSVTVTDRRMYVAGPEYGSATPTGSTIQVIDISDAKGDMVEGAAVPAKGQISSRWQMDEWSGVLRVISQPPASWDAKTGRTFTVPSVQTFRVTSAQQVDALGQTDLTLPVNETLRSARFDGPRAYAITAEQKDPLLTIDLSDPARPRQVGQLVMPGFVYYMEPRGDRVLGLGFDQGNPAGSITVSLFDVKDLAAPKQLSRVNFGGSWGSLPEDQDRIQKVFRVLDDAGLILVPFSGWNTGSFDKATGCGETYSGGVEIIDFKNDTLVGRGAAPSSGETRRALLAHDHLLTVGDERVQSFDIADRDAPALVSQVVLSRYTFRALQLDGAAVARISQDGQTGRPLIDFVGSADAGDPNQSYGELDLSGVAGGGGCAKSLSVDNAFVHGSELDLLYSSYGVDAAGSGTNARGVLVIDASDPKHARLVSDTHWDNNDNWYAYDGFYTYGSYSGNVPVVRTEHTLSMLESSWVPQGENSVQRVRLRVIDLRKPDAVQTALLALGSDSYSGLVVDGDTLLTSHFIGNSAQTSRARFYVDRLDVSDPAAPKRVSSINVPGALLQYDRASGRVLTTEQSRVVVPNLTWTECNERFAYADFAAPDANGGVAIAAPAASGSASSGSAGSDSGVSGATPTVSDPVPEPKGVCTGYRQRLHLVALGAGSARLEDSFALDENQQLTASSLGDGVVFATLGRGYSYFGRGIAVDCLGPCGGPQTVQPIELLVLGGFDKGKLEVGHIRVEDSADAWWGFWGTPPVYAFGSQALLIGQSDIAVIDASTPSAPKLARKLPLIASPQYVDLRGDTALLTLGSQGVQWLSLD